VRWFAMGAIALGATLALSGCTVANAGISGIGVDQKGNPVGYLMVCHDHVNAAELGHGKDIWDGTWDSAQSITGFATFNLADPGPGWTVERPLATLTPRHTYTFYGGTTDNSWSTSSVHFTLADLAQLQPGQVRYWTGHGPGGYATVSVADFQTHACDYQRGG